MTTSPPHVIRGHSPYGSPWKPWPSCPDVGDGLMDGYDDYLEWVGQQPCASCYEDNDHCCCQELDERFGEIPWPEEEDEEYDT